MAGLCRVFAGGERGRHSGLAARDAALMGGGEAAAGRGQQGSGPLRPPTRNPGPGRESGDGDPRPPAAGGGPWPEGSEEVNFDF